MACLSSIVPLTGVYFVKFLFSASMAASLMFLGVGKSGSPALKSTTSLPSALRRPAVAATFMVDDSLIQELRSASCFIFFFQARFDEGRNNALDAAAERRDFFHEFGADEGVLFASGQKNGFEIRS